MITTQEYEIENGVLKKYNGSDSEVTVPVGVTEIGDSAFRGNTRLCRIAIPYGVKTLGLASFLGCTALTEITLPETVQTLGAFAFEECTALHTVNLSEELREIEIFAFRGCTALRALRLPERLERIASCAFYQCSALEKISIPPRLFFMGQGAFDNCTALRTVVFRGNFPKTLERECFRGCTALEEIRLPGLLRVIGSNAFEHCRALRSITLPDSLVLIRDNAFLLCTSLEQITLPKNVTTVSFSAFSNCTALREVVLPQGLQKLYKRAFQRCYCLTRVKVYPPVEKSRAFEIFWRAVDEDIKDAILIDALKRGDNSFGLIDKAKRQKMRLAKLAVTFNDPSILSLLFERFLWISLEDLEEMLLLAASDPSVTAFLMEYKRAHYSPAYLERYEKEKVELELGLRQRTISEWKKLYSYKFCEEGLALTGYKGHQKVICIPEAIGGRSVLAIEKRAFSPAAVRSREEIRKRRVAIESVTVPEGVHSIGEEAFSHCTHLKSVHLPASVTSIGKDAFLFTPWFTLYAPAGSFAEAYAKENHIAFEAE